MSQMSQCLRSLV